MQRDAPKMPKMLLFSSSRNTQWIKITFELSNVIFIPEWMELGVECRWSGGVDGVGEFMEWGNSWSGGVYGVGEFMECGSGWSVGVDGMGEWMDCMGVGCSCNINELALF